MLIRTVVRNDVHEDFQPQGMRVFEEAVEVFEGFGYIRSMSR